MPSNISGKKQEKQEKRKKYFIKGKDVITDSGAPVVSNEFIDKVDGHDYHGQTLEVQSETKLEADEGVGNAFVLRTFTFALDPSLKHKVLPPSQDIFNSFARGIEAMLWSDGLRPVMELPPRLVFTKKKTHVLIMIWAEPRLGQVITETPKTLSEIIRDPRKNQDKV